MATIDGMDVTPQLLHDVEFREAKRGGYNTQDVDEFLERLAVGLERQDTVVREARQRIEVAEARAAEAERRAVQAETAAAETSASDETLMRTLVLAQKTADAAIREAEEQASRTLTGAQVEAERLLTEAQDASARAQAQAEQEAREAHEEARAQVLSDLHELEAAREQLREDVEILERHLDDQRERIRRAVHELGRSLDDPESLREAQMPVISDVSAPIEAPIEQPAPMPQRAPLSAEPLPVDDEHPAEWIPDDEVWGDAEDDVDTGPPTQAVDVLAERDDDDDAYLAELRKAMTDDTPLGPRDEADHSALFDSGVEAGRSRFGRRR